MGGTTSKSDHIEFELRPVFAKWTLDNVTEAITRWQSFHSRHSCFLLTRRVFFEVFSDYGVVDEDGNFLSIPLHVFSAFDPRKSGSVPALEIFFMLLLFCQGDISEKIMTAFSFFDQDHEGFCSKCDMVVLVQSCLGAMYKAGITQRQSTPDDVEALVEEALAHDTNVDSKLSLHEFIRWSRNQLATQEIIHRFGVKASDATSTHAASCLESAVNQAAASTSQAGGGVDPSTASGSPKADSDGKGTPGTGTDSGDNASGSRSPSHKRRSKRKHKPKLTHQMSSLNMALLDKGTKSLGGGASVNTAQTIEEQLRAMGVDDIDSFRIASTPSPEGNDAEAAAATTSPTSNAARRRRSVSPPHHGQPSSPVASPAPLPRSTLYAAHADLATSPQPSSPVDASQRQGRNGLKPIRGATQATPEATSPTASAGQRQATASSKRRGRRLSSTEAAMEASGGQFAQYLRDVQMLENKAKAITRRALLDKKTLRHGAMATHFTVAEVRKLAKVFARFCGTANYITKRPFVKILKNHMPGIVADATLVDRVFAVSDPDGDNRVQFGEFCVAMDRTMRGSMDERLNYVFQLFGAPDPTTGELCMGVSDLVNLIKQGNKRLDKIVGLASTIMQAFDDDGNNEIEQVEFLDMVSKNSTWLDAFANFVSVPPQLAKHLHVCMAIHPNIKHHAILTGIRKCYAGQLNLLAEIESVDDLARVVTVIFGPVPAMEVDAFGKSLANAFRELKSAYVNVLVRDVINCWSKVSTHDVLKQVLIFFKCADADGSGALDRHELMHMLLTTQKKLANQARLIVDMLAALDENGDGSVSLNEFQASARRQPLVLSSIDSLFQVNRNNMSGVLPSPVSYNGQAKGVAVRCGKDMTGRGRVKRSNRRHRGIVARLQAQNESSSRPGWNSSRPTKLVYGAPAPTLASRGRPVVEVASAAPSVVTEDRAGESTSGNPGEGAAAGSPVASPLRKTLSTAQLVAKLPPEVLGAHLTRTASRMLFGVNADGTPASSAGGGGGGAKHRGAAAGGYRWPASPVRSPQHHQSPAGGQHPSSVQSSASTGKLRFTPVSKHKNAAKRVASKLRLLSQDLAAYTELQPGEAPRRRKRRPKTPIGTRHRRPPGAKRLATTAEEAEEVAVVTIDDLQRDGFLSVPADGATPAVQVSPIKSRPRTAPAQQIGKRKGKQRAGSGAPGSAGGSAKKGPPRSPSRGHPGKATTDRKPGANTHHGKHRGKDKRVGSSRRHPQAE